MIERGMEDLICAYPEEFFDRPLTFVDRQRIFPGVGKFDVLFSDRFENQILMELKAVTAKSGDADQLVRYQEALIANGHRNIILWLVAPMIPKQTTDFLDRYGIEHSVIHEARYRQVAERHDYKFATEIREIDQNRSEGKSGAERPPTTSGFSFSTTAKKTGDEKDFLKRCDEEGKLFFSPLFERQRASTGKTKITWDHESGFSLQFYFARFGYVPFVWGFPEQSRG
jgi:Endonuclease NucS